MFTPRPKNRKRRSRKLPLYRKGRRKTSADPVQALREKEFQLNAQIGTLEDVLADLVDEEAKKESMRRDNIIPAPQSRKKRHHQRRRPSLSSSQRRIKKRQGNAGVVQFLVLLIIAGALAFWLFYTGG